MRPLGASVPDEPAAALFIRQSETKTGIEEIASTLFGKRGITSPSAQRKPSCTGCSRSQQVNISERETRSPLIAFLRRAIAGEFPVEHRGRRKQCDDCPSRCHSP